MLNLTCTHMWFSMGCFHVTKDHFKVHLHCAISLSDGFTVLLILSGGNDQRKCSHSPSLGVDLPLQILDTFRVVQ